MRISAWFGHEWRSQWNVLRKGQEVGVEGEIEELGRHVIRLINCKFISPSPLPLF
jgi:hypothetical protein